MEKQIIDILTEMRKEITELKSGMDNLNTDMTTVKSGMDILNTDMSTVKSGMDNLNTDMTTVKSGMDNLNSDMTNVKSGMGNLRSEMHGRFDSVEAKLQGIGNQFELTAESRITETSFISDKVNKMEKEIYYLKTKNNS